MILWFWLCEKISYLTTLLWYFIDHTSCHLHVNFLGICTRLRAHLYVEKILVSREIFQIKPILWRPHLSTRCWYSKNPMESLNIFSWPISLQKKKKNSFQSSVVFASKSFSCRHHLRKFNQYSVASDKLYFIYWVVHESTWIFAEIILSHELHLITRKRANFSTISWNSRLW